MRPKQVASKILRGAYRATQAPFDWFDGRSRKTQAIVLTGSLIAGSAQIAVLAADWLIPTGFRKEIPPSDWVDALLDIGGSMCLLFFALMLGPEKRRKRKEAKP